jgi:hypothetical protein
MYPRIDRVEEYLDWRRAYGGKIDTVLPDFENADVIVRGAWERVLDYLEASWRAHLLTVAQRRRSRNASRTSAGRWPFSS